MAHPPSPDGPTDPPPEGDAVSGVPAALLQFQLTLRPPTPETSLPQLLASFDDYTNQDLPVVGEVTRQVPVREIAGWRVTADIYRPLGEPPYPVLVFFHGGGWVMGSPWTHRRLAADLAALGLLTILVDYRRAPKHRFPAAVEDAVHAIGWAQDAAPALGGDTSRLLVGGDSAGANLAAAALATGRAGSVAAALLCYGIFDVHRALPKLTGLIGGPDPRTQLYLEPEDMTSLVDDPRLHPERYCADFPPTLVLAGEQDPLLWESKALSECLKTAFVPHDLVVVADAPHGFLQLPSHPAHTLGIQAIQRFLCCNNVVPSAQ